MSLNWYQLLGKHDFWAKICSRAMIDRGGGPAHPPPPTRTWQVFQTSPSLELRMFVNFSFHFNLTLIFQYLFPMKFVFVWRVCVKICNTKISKDIKKKTPEIFMSCFVSQNYMNLWLSIVNILCWWQSW